MAELYSQYASGIQFAAGTIAGSALGTSGLNPIVDRLNSISTDNSLVSGTSLVVHASGNSNFSREDHFITIRANNFTTVAGGTTVDSTKLTATESSTNVIQDINIPNGAVLDYMGVFGSGTISTWSFLGREVNGESAPGVLASGNSLGSIFFNSDPINNELNGYNLTVFGLTSGTELYSVSLRYLF